jgi:tRNA pseudouridine55 synthase
MSIVTWNKKYTETLAETLDRFRHNHSKYAESKITYAGRLDPMAEGLMILLTHEDVHRKDEFLKLDKVYEVDFILGMSTDTYDILGVVSPGIQKDIPDDGMAVQITELQDVSSQVYPPYSSKTVEGKALWQWAREGKLDEITLPHKEVSISRAEYLGSEKISSDELSKNITSAISSISGDFRQEQILQSWDSYFNISKQNEWGMYTMRIYASSGTYMRTLVDSIGKQLGTMATTVKIKRIKVGDYVLESVDK